MTITTSVSTQNHVGSQVGQQDSQNNQNHEETSKSEGTQAGGTLQQPTGGGGPKTMSQGTGTRTRDYHEDMGHDMHLLSNSRRSKSKSTEDMNVGKYSDLLLDSSIASMTRPLSLYIRRSGCYEAHDEADGEHRESGDVTGNGAEALQLLQQCNDDAPFAPARDPSGGALDE